MIPLLGKKNLLMEMELIKIGKIISIGKKENQTTVLREERTVQCWFRSLDANRRGMSAQRTKQSVLSGLRRYIEFLGSGPKENFKLTLEDLIREAEESRNAEKARDRINDFYNWLTGEEVLNYSPRGKKISLNSARNIAYSQIRGFYRHNGVYISGLKTPSRQRAMVSRVDSNVKLVKKDDENNHRLNYDVFLPFFRQLSLRDQVVVACLVSGGGPDLCDLLKLTVGDLRNKNNYINGCFIFSGVRQKTRKLFEVFFSRSATGLVRGYLESERFKVNNNEPLFILKHKGNENPKLSPEAVCQSFRYAAKSIGYDNGGGHGPFRSKRFRHVFNKIASENGIPRNIIRRWQGHALDMSEEYHNTEISLEESFEYYLKIMPFLEVFEVYTPQNEQVDSLTEENITLRETIKKLESRIKGFEELKSRVGVLEQKYRVAYETSKG